MKTLVNGQQDMNTNNEVSKAAAALGRLGGKSKSSAKVQASKSNGAKGGRPNMTLEIRRRLRGSTRGRKNFPADVRAAVVTLGDILRERRANVRNDSKARAACRAFDDAMRAAGLRVHDAGGPLNP